MSTLSADTNLFLYAANPDSPWRPAARHFLDATPEGDFVLSEFVLVELYMLLRNPSVLTTPLAASEAADYCERLRARPGWQVVDYEPIVSRALWRWARETTAGFRRIIDARLALTLRHHGVTDFATANVRDFDEFGFDRVWNPVGHRQA